MTTPLRAWAVLLPMSALIVAMPASALQTPPISSVAAAGDSITKGFNADQRSCTFDDHEAFNWATSDTNGSDFCAAGDENVFSLTERLECRQQADVISPEINQAKSGAQMLKDFFNQANTIKSYISAQPAPRLTTILLGHNDAVGFGFFGRCATSDQDPNNGCRTSPAAFEREFRKGLDVLITIPDLHIGVASPLRLTQRCPQCPAAFIVPFYQSLRTYRDILSRVSAEYAAIPSGGTSLVTTIGGETVGGATKAPGTTTAYSDAPWHYRFARSEISRCDRIHPSAAGQTTLARILDEGLVCSETSPCCQDTGNLSADAACSSVTINGTFFPGFF